jgi:predicted GNAT family N-acyltransferase
VGARLLEEAERAAVAVGAGRVQLHAQMAALSLYSRGGYEQVGEPFLEQGIEHVTMELALA